MIADLVIAALLALAVGGFFGGVAGMVYLDARPEPPERCAMPGCGRPRDPRRFRCAECGRYYCALHVVPNPAPATSFDRFICDLCAANREEWARLLYARQPATPAKAWGWGRLVGMRRGE